MLQRLKKIQAWYSLVIPVVCNNLLTIIAMILSVFIPKLALWLVFFYIIKKSYKSIFLVIKRLIKGCIKLFVIPSIILCVKLLLFIINSLMMFLLLQTLYLFYYEVVFSFRVAFKIGNFFAFMPFPLFYLLVVIFAIMYLMIIILPILIGWWKLSYWIVTTNFGVKYTYKNSFIFFKNKTLFGITSIDKNWYTIFSVHLWSSLLLFCLIEISANFVEVNFFTTLLALLAVINSLILLLFLKWFRYILVLAVSLILFNSIFAITVNFASIFGIIFSGFLGYVSVLSSDLKMFFLYIKAKALILKDKIIKKIYHYKIVIYLKKKKNKMELVLIHRQSQAFFRKYTLKEKIKRKIRKLKEPNNFNNFIIRVETFLLILLLFYILLI